MGAHATAPTGALAVAGFGAPKGQAGRPTPYNGPILAAGGAPAAATATAAATRRPRFIRDERAGTLAPDAASPIICHKGPSTPPAATSTSPTDRALVASEAAPLGAARPRATTPATAAPAEPLTPLRTVEAPPAGAVHVPGPRPLGAYSALALSAPQHGFLRPPATTSIALVRWG